MKKLCNVFLIILVVFLWYKYIGTHKKNIICTMKNTLEALPNVKSVEFPYTEFWNYNIIITMNDGVILKLRDVKKDLSFSYYYGGIEQIENIKFLTRIKKGKKDDNLFPWLIIHALQNYMKEDLHTVPLVLENYSKILETINSFETYSYADVPHDELESLIGGGTDKAGLQYYMCIWKSGF